MEIMQGIIIGSVILTLLAGKLIRLWRDVIPIWIISLINCQGV